MIVGDIVTGTVVKIQKTHFIVMLEDGTQGMVHVSGVSDYYVNNLGSMFKVGSDYDFKLIEIDEEKKRVKLDWKSIHPRFLKNPFKYIIKETENGSKNLIENTMKEVKND